MSDAFGDEEYRGPATLRIGPDDVAVTVRLSARFEPAEGRVRWAGRTAPDADLLRRVEAGLNEAAVVLPGGRETPAKLSEPDPWGGIRLSGTGRPPWYRAAQQQTAEQQTAGQQTAGQEAAGQRGTGQ